MKEIQFTAKRDQGGGKSEAFIVQFSIISYMNVFDTRTEAIY